MSFKERYPKTAKFIRDEILFFTGVFTFSVLLDIYIWKTTPVVNESWIREQLTQALITATLLTIIMPWCERHYDTSKSVPEKTPTS